MFLRKRCRALLAACLLACSVLHADRANALPTKDECISANESGQDARHAARIREAIERFDSCAAISCPGPIRSDCARRADEARRAMPTLSLHVQDDAGAALHDVAITVDGVRIESENGQLSLDPGEHRFEFSAKGFAPLVKNLVVREGVKVRDEHVLLHRVVASQAPDQRPVREAASPRDAQIQSATSESGTSQRTIAYVVGGAGVVAAGIGSVLLWNARDSYDEANATCGGAIERCAIGRGSAAEETLSSARTQAVGSTISFVAAGLLIAGGLYLFLTAPRADSTRSASLGRGGLVGTW